MAAVLRARRADRAAGARRGVADTGTITTFWPDATIFETTTWNFETLSRRLQEMAFLNRGLTITLTDERPDADTADTDTDTAAREW